MEEIVDLVMIGPTLKICKSMANSEVADWDAIAAFAESNPLDEEIMQAIRIENLLRRRSKVGVRVA